MPKNIQPRSCLHSTRWLPQILLILALTATLASPAGATPSLPKNLTSAVVTLTSSSFEGCATGFFLNDGRLITNNHVAEALCPSGICSGIVLKQSAILNTPPSIEVPHGDVVVEQRLTAFDLAVLSVKPGNGPLPISLFKAGPPSQSVQKISVLGFPVCGSLGLSEGLVREETPMSYQTTALGNYGSSGSPVFTDDYTVVGVVKQAGSISEALSATLFKTAFSLKAVNGDVLSQIVGKDEAGVISAQAKLLEREYREHIVNLNGVDRILYGLEMFTNTDNIKNQIRLSPLASKYATIFMPLGDYPLHAVLPRIETDELGAALRRLIFMSNLEYKGFYGAALAPLNPEAISPSLVKAGYSTAEADDFAKLAINLIAQNYHGSMMAMMFDCVYFVLISWLLLLLLSFSLGYVFARERGASFGKRLLAISLVAILFWPVSFLVYLVRRARLDREKAKGPEPKRETVMEAKKKKKRK